jgi:hypothetical protein
LNTTSKVEQTKQFFIEKIQAQAAKEGIPISDKELRVLNFSVQNADPDLSLMEGYDGKVEQDFEKKMSYLLSPAMKSDSDISPHGKDPYVEGKKVLDTEDHYLGVIVAAAFKAKAPKNPQVQWKNCPITWPLEPFKQKIGKKAGYFFLGVFSLVSGIVVAAVAALPVLTSGRLVVGVYFQILLAIAMLLWVLGLLGLGCSFFWMLFFGTGVQSRSHKFGYNLQYFSLLVGIVGAWLSGISYEADAYKNSECTMGTVTRIFSRNTQCDHFYKVHYPCAEFQAEVSFNLITGQKTGNVELGFCALSDNSCAPKVGQQIALRYYRGGLALDNFTENWGALTLLSVLSAYLLSCLLISRFVLKEQSLTKWTFLIGVTMIFVTVVWLWDKICTTKKSNRETKRF